MAGSLDLDQRTKGIESHPISTPNPFSQREGRKKLTQAWDPHQDS